MDPQNNGRQFKPTLKAAKESREPLFIGRHTNSAFLVFLDFDGVLHPLGPGQTRFSNAPFLYRALMDLASQCVTCSLALTTTWRFQPMDLILSELDLAAPGLASLVEGRCGRIEPSETPSWLGSRHAEILDYCAKRTHGAAPPRAILDDQASLFGSGHPPLGLILCDPTLGFTAAEARTLASIANISLAIRSPRIILDSSYAMESKDPGLAMNPTQGR